MAIQGKSNKSKEWYCENGDCANIIERNEQYCSPCLEDVGEKVMGNKTATDKLNHLNSGL